MASSIKVLLRKKPNKIGQYPIVIRIIHNRKSTYYFTGYYIDLKHWDDIGRKVKKNHPNSSRLNNMIAQKLAEANNTLLDLQANHDAISVEQIKKEITSPSSKRTFNELSQEYLIELQRNNKLSRYSSDKARVKYFIEFSNSQNIKFSEIDENKLRKYMTYLKTNRRNSQRSIINCLIVIRTIFNRAIRQGIIDRKYYPFGADKIRIKFPETDKVGLNTNEVKAIEELSNLTPPEEHTRNVWLFSFYLAGMRVADVLKIRWSDIYDGRLHYRMNKNNKLVSLKLPAKINPILEFYEECKNSNDSFIFPELNKANLQIPSDVLAKTKTATKKFNRSLESIKKKAEIEKKITMHIARHTFGNISGDKIPIQILQKLYRHSSIITTINYQSNFTHKEEDQALDKVINF